MSRIVAQKSMALANSRTSSWSDVGEPDTEIHMYLLQEFLVPVAGRVIPSPLARPLTCAKGESQHQPKDGQSLDRLAELAETGWARMLTCCCGCELFALA